MKKIFIYLLIIASTAYSQQVFTHKKLQLNGYIKSMQSWGFPDQPNIYSSHLLHNRINIKWQPNKYFSIGAEWRNRVISGDEVRMYDDYASRLKNPNDKWDAAILWADTKDLVGVTNTERLWVSFKNKKWFFRLGRQRVNWSNTTTWNPNDIFNSYNFLDFDYEERPGCDGIQGRYLINDKSNIEANIAFAGNTGKSISAIKYFTQLNNWDLQIISGIYEDQFTIGGSWAKSIRGAGWKGEWQYFHQTNNAVFNFSTEIDYLLKSKWYIKAGVLYNSMGLMNKVQSRQQLQFKMTPIQQMPGAWNLELMGMKSFNDIIKTSVTLIYAPYSNIIILIPSCSFSISDNATADILLQQFFLKEIDWNTVLLNGFIRLKYSF